MKSIYEKDNNKVLHDNVRGTVKDITVTDSTVTGTIVKQSGNEYPFTLDLQNRTVAVAEPTTPTTPSDPSGSNPPSEPIDPEGQPPEDNIDWDTIKQTAEKPEEQTSTDDVGIDANGHICNLDLSPVNFLLIVSSFEA